MKTGESREFFWWAMGWAAIVVSAGLSVFLLMAGWALVRWVP